MNDGINTEIELKDIDELILNLNTLQQFLICIGLEKEIFRLLQSKSIHSIKNLNYYLKDQFNRKLLKITQEQLTLLDKNLIKIVESSMTLDSIRNIDYDLSSISLTKTILLDGGKQKTSNKKPSPSVLFISILNNKKIDLVNFQTEPQIFNNLKFLHLSDNKVQAIDGLSSLSNLITLDLSNNYIRKIENLDCLCYLETLNLKNNMILLIENISSNISLKTFDISYQKLTELQRLSIDNNSFNFDNNLIENLILDGNKLIDSDMININLLVNIRQLSLSNNNIQEIENLINILQILQNLENFVIHNNPVFTKYKNSKEIIISNSRSLKELNNKAIGYNERCYIDHFYNKENKPFDLNEKTDNKLTNIEVIVADDFYQKQYERSYVKEMNNNQKRKSLNAVIKPIQNNIFPKLEKQSNRLIKQTEIGLAVGTIGYDNITNKNTFIPSSKAIGKYLTSNKLKSDSSLPTIKSNN